MEATNRQLSDASISFWDREYSQASFTYVLLSAEVVDPVVMRLSEHGCRAVLDVGCGFGRMAIALALRGFEVTAIDVTESAIQWVRKWAVKENAVIATQVCSAEQLSFISSFDAVYCNSVLDHMPFESAKVSVQNIAKALRPDGLAFLSFDGPEVEDCGESTTLDDGTLVYGSGRRSGKLWRFNTDSEIRELCHGLEIVDFVTGVNGQRRVWVRTPKST
jgi:SAM-dependent methyltransferase